MQNRECIVFKQTLDRESTSHVRVCESHAHHVLNQLAGGSSFASKAIVVEFACWNFLFPAAKEKQCGKIYCVFEAK